MRWLIVLDGTERSEKAAAFTAPFVRAEEDEVLLFAVGENVQEKELAAALERNRANFAGVRRFETIVPDGLAQAVAEAAEEEDVDIVVYGSRGRRGWSRLLLGSVATYLERHLDCSLLVVRGELRPLKNILIASSLYPQTRQPMTLATLLAQRTGAAVTLLHVMSQLPLSDDANIIPLKATAEEAMALHTREGEQLAARIDHMEKAGVKAQAKLRHGLVLDELTKEMTEGNYDLLVIGAHREPEAIPLWKLLAEDVAEEILMATRAPLLIA